MSSAKRGACPRHLVIPTKILVLLYFITQTPPLQAAGAIRFGYSEAFLTYKKIFYPHLGTFYPRFMTILLNLKYRAAIFCLVIYCIFILIYNMRNVFHLCFLIYA